MAVSFYILAGYIRPSRRSNEAAAEVFRPRRVLARHPALRHVDALRAHGQHALPNDCDRAGGGQRRADAAAGGDPARRRHRVQDRRRAVPHVGAGRLRRVADAGHRVPVRRFEGGRIRHAAADFHRGPARLQDGRPRDGVGEPARLELVLLHPGDRHDDRRQHRRPDAGQFEADAGRTRRWRRAVTSSSGSSPGRRAASPPRSSTCSPTCSCSSGRSPSSRRFATAEVRGDQLQDLSGLYATQSRDGAGDADFHALARPGCRRRPASWRSSSVFGAAVDAGYIGLAVIGVLEQRACRCTTTFASWCSCGRPSPGWRQRR